MRTWWVWPVLVVAWIFQLLTVPVSAHMVGRAGYRTKHLHPELLSSDELEAVVQKAAGKGGFTEDDGDAGHRQAVAGWAKRRSTRRCEPDALDDPLRRCPGSWRSG